MPTEVAARIEAMGGVWSALTTVAPGLKGAARVSRASTSSGLFREDTGEQIAELAAPTSTCWSRTEATSSAFCMPCTIGAGSTGWAGM